MENKQPGHVKTRDIIGEVKTTMAKNRDMGNLFMTFLLIVIALALTPTVASSVTTAAASLTGAAATLCNLIPLFWVVIIIAVGVAAIYMQMKGGW